MPPESAANRTKETATGIAIPTRRECYCPTAPGAHTHEPRPDEPTYENPATGLTFTLQHESIGNTYDPPNGADMWHCPLCGRPRSDRKYDGFRGTYGALQKHLSEDHNVRITQQRIEITVGRIFDDRGQVVRYVDDR